jgi:hypothetical protein
MNVIKQSVSRRNTINGIPITGNILRLSANKTDMYWEMPQDSWHSINGRTSFSASSTTKTMMANFRFDDSEHSPDLFVYTTIKVKHINSFLEENRHKISLSNPLYNFKVRQHKPMDRVGIKKFAFLPLYQAIHLWRKPLSTENCMIFKPKTSYKNLTEDACKKILTSSILSLNYKEYSFKVNLMTINEDMYKFFINQKNRDKNSYISFESMTGSLYPMIEYMRRLRNIAKFFYPISDYDSMFEDAEEEFFYITEITNYGGK